MLATVYQTHDTQDIVLFIINLVFTSPMCKHNNDPCYSYYKNTLRIFHKSSNDLRVNL